MALDSYKKVLTRIDDAHTAFDDVISKQEKRLFDHAVELIKKLDTDDKGFIKPNVANLKRIAEIRVSLAKFANNKEYLAGVKDLMKAFDDIYAAQRAYFSQVANRQTPENKYKAMKQIAVNNVATGLSGAGLSANVTDKIGDMLLRAVTSGAKYADLTSELHEYLVSNEKSEGALAKYAKTYATTALTQYAGQNNRLLTDDIGCEWFTYTGSEIETTREFCALMLQKEYIHISEFEDIVKGRIEIDGEIHQCKIYDKTGLPCGMIEGTNAENLQVNVGGWNCRHQLVPIAREAVPEHIRAKFENAVVEEIPEKELTDCQRWIRDHQAELNKFAHAFEVFGIDLITPTGRYENYSYRWLDMQWEMNMKTYRKRMRTLNDIGSAWSSLLKKAKAANAVSTISGIESEMPKYRIENMASFHDFVVRTHAFNGQYRYYEDMLKSESERIAAERAKGVTAEGLVALNNSDIETLLNIAQGEIMSFEKANHGRGNINYVQKYVPVPEGQRPEGYLSGVPVITNPEYKPRSHKKYLINCQSCVVAHELRVRGFNVTATGNTKGSINEELSHGCYKAWKTKDGHVCDRSDATLIRSDVLYGTLRSASYVKNLLEKVTDVGRYQLRWSWGESFKGHTIFFERTKTSWRAYDPQNGEEYTTELDFAKAIDGIGSGGLHCLRIDDKLFNTDYIGVVTPLK